MFIFLFMFVCWHLKKRREKKKTRREKKKKPARRTLPVVSLVDVAEVAATSRKWIPRCKPRQTS